VGIQDPSCSLDNQTMKIRGPEVIGKRFTQTVQKIKNPVFLDLQVFPRPP
jgi:hypothetical protein